MTGPSPSPTSTRWSEDTPPNPVSGNVLRQRHRRRHARHPQRHTKSTASRQCRHATAGTYGNVTINSDGNYSYTLDNSKASVQALAEGQSVTDTFTYTNADNHGATSSTTLTIHRPRTNDGPVAVADLNSVSEDTPPNPVSGNVLGNDTDVDTLDHPQRHTSQRPRRQCRQRHRRHLRQCHHQFRRQLQLHAGQLQGLRGSARRGPIPSPTPSPTPTPTITGHLIHHAHHHRPRHQ